MKKAVLIALALGVGYYAFGRKTETSGTLPGTVPTTGGPPIGEVAELVPTHVFKQYNNQVIADSNGHWMLVKDGKLFTPTSLETLQSWQRANPDKPGVVQVPFAVWTAFLDQKEVYGGSF